MAHETPSPPQRPSTLDAVIFVALLATALAMGAALAHALELPNKMALGRNSYFIVQDIYRGWDKLAWLIGVELAAMVGLAVMVRRMRTALRATLTAIGCLVAAQAVFWIWTFPANKATQNWTRVPANWEALRIQWECSHLAGAVFQVLALCALIVAALARGRDTA